MAFYHRRRLRPARRSGGGGGRNCSGGGSGERDAIIATLDDDDDGASADCNLAHNAFRRCRERRTLKGRNRNPFHPSESLCLLQLLLYLIQSPSLSCYARSSRFLPTSFCSCRSIFVSDRGREGALQLHQCMLLSCARWRHFDTCTPRRQISNRQNCPSHSDG